MTGNYRGKKVKILSIYSRTAIERVECSGCERCVHDGKKDDLCYFDAHYLGYVIEYEDGMVSTAQASKVEVVAVSVLDEVNQKFAAEEKDAA